MAEHLLVATVSVRGVVRGDDGRVLTVRRASDGRWELPGGRLQAGEDVPAGLRRELAEETGLEPTVHRPVHVISWRNDVERDRLAVYYRCRASAEAVTTSEEHVESEWVTVERARERLSESQATAVARACERPLRERA